MIEDNAKKNWAKASKYLSEVLGQDAFQRWIAVIEPVSYVNNTLLLSVPNDFYQDWLEENYLSLIKDAVGACYEDEVNIKFSFKNQPTIQDEPILIKPKQTQNVKKKTFAPKLNSKFTFNNFIVGSSNQFAHAASMAVAQAPGKAYNPLFIYGGVGLGKTHLMHAIGHHILSTLRANIYCTTCESMMNEYIDALQNQGLVQFRKKYRNADVLLIDDIHFLGGKERLQEEFFHTFNALFDMRKQIIMTSDRPANEIGGLAQRLVSRFEWGLVTELEVPALETRIAILREKQESYDIKLNDEIITFIAENIRSNVRKLEGALVRTISYASLTGKELTIDLVSHLLRDTLEQEKSMDITFETIQKAVASYYDIRLADMTSKRRPRNLAVPRQVAMYLCRAFTDSSLPDIANSFGKTHATVLHAYNSIKSKMDIEPKLKQDVSQIVQKLGKSINDI